MDVNFQDILQALGPGTGQDAIWSVFLYIIFFFAMITLFLTPDKNMVPTLLIAGVLMATIVAKLSLGTSPPLLERKEFGMMIVNITMFIFPIIAVGMLRAKKNRMAAPAIITAVTGFVYFFMFWLVVQRA